MLMSHVNCQKVEKNFDCTLEWLIDVSKSLLSDMKVGAFFFFFFEAVKACMCVEDSVQ